MYVLIYSLLFSSFIKAEIPLFYRKKMYTISETEFFSKEVSPFFKTLPLFYYREKPLDNFGDYLSLKLVERIVNMPVKVYQKTPATLKDKKLLAIGSIFTFAGDGDVIWGSGINGKRLDKKYYNFKNLDIRAVRGPLTRNYLWDNFKIKCPEIYGDPALLVPYFFPEFKRKKNPQYDFVLIVHYSDKVFFPRTIEKHIIYATDPWYEIIEKIVDSRLVISTALHGIVVAEAYGIPARLLKISNSEPLFKYMDYYLGTQRPDFKYATTLEEALRMGGEPPFICNLAQLYQAFPKEFWPEAQIQQLSFESEDNEL